MNFVHSKPFVLIGYDFNRHGFAFFKGTVSKSFREYIKR